MSKIKITIEYSNEKGKGVREVSLSEGQFDLLTREEKGERLEKSVYSIINWQNQEMPF